MQEPDKQQVEALLKSIVIPPQPKVVMDLMTLFKNPDPDFRTIIKLVSSDLALSAKMMKLVNSPLFGARSRVETLNQALMLLGCDNFHNLVLASSLQSTFAGRKENQGQIDLLLTHCFKIAKICEFITAKRPQVNSIISRDFAYLTGLFHDCGIPLLLGKYPEYKEVFPSILKNTFSSDLEDQQFSTNHSLGGYLMAKTWHLPRPALLAILNHHQVEFDENGLVPPEETDKKVWAVLVLAELIAPMVLDADYRGRCVFDDEWMERHHRVLDELSLDEPGVQRILDDLDEVLE